MTDNKIEPVYDMEIPPMGRCAEIRFDCLVKMFDSGIRTKKSGLIINTEKELPPQWFKNEMRLTLEAVEYGDPHELGMALKNMFKQLDIHIKNYEKQ